MDKETLSNYGWIVICVLVLAVMIALAGPFGTFVAGAVKSTTAGLFGVNQNALGAAGITIDDQAFANCEHLETEIRNATADYSGDTCCKECGTVLSTGAYVIPEGGLYTTADGTVYNPGDEMPEVVTTGDIYTYGDYEYKYNHYYHGHQNVKSWKADTSLSGWGVKVINKSKSTYGQILETINGEPITSLYYLFEGCTSLTTAPIIPQYVINIGMAFNGCTALKTYVGSTDPDGDFSGYIIPNNVQGMAWTFAYCSQIKTTPIVPSSVSTMYHTFYSCTALKTVSTIHNGVTNMFATFAECTNLTNISAIPSSVTSLQHTFQNCTSLTGNIIIDTNNITTNKSSASGDTKSCYNCFNGVEMTNITLSGSASKDVLNLIGGTGINWTPIE